MPINTSTICADIHFFAFFNFSPTQFTVRNKKLVLFFLFLLRETLKFNYSLFGCDEENFLSAKRTIGMIPPPSDQTIFAESMATF